MTKKELIESIKDFIEKLNQKENMDTSKLKPFNLEAAKAGEPIVLKKDGSNRHYIGYNKYEKSDFKVVISDDYGNISAYNDLGQSFMSDNENYCLFMKPQEVVKWVNVYTNFCNELNPSCFFDSEEQALQNTGKSAHSTYIGTYPITITI